ncbi:hypothetical protein BOX15_Mlig023733g3 [Macrostomum lignano]|uniref:Col_cuticle_N domain-containing protein n=1 Tax=Macrostomum lignano TaxID=282301 RepID=A0A267DDG4_9PLAT|nr:hypothetical protein BOX15_Mlig023733g3 [Macrostomum lignano]
MLGIVAFISILLSLSPWARSLSRAESRLKALAACQHDFPPASRRLHRLPAHCDGHPERDRRWMPRPDQNRLGFAYAMALIACLACTFTVGFLAMMYIKEDEEQLVFSDVTDAGPDIARGRPVPGDGRLRRR